jgi:excisionase family DNA binding protein
MTEQTKRESAELSLPIPANLVEAIAQRVAELTREQVREACAPESPWLDFNAAAGYLGFSRDKLYKLTAAKAIPFRKKQDGQGLLFHRDELDHWLEGRYPRESWPS